MTKYSFAASVVWVFFSIHCEAQELTWSDTTGAYKLEASFKGLDADGTITLQKATGETANH